MFNLSVGPVGSPSFRALAQALDQYVANLAEISNDDKSPREMENAEAADLLLELVNAEYAKLAVNPLDK